MKNLRVFLFCAFVFALAACSNSNLQTVPDDEATDNGTTGDQAITTDDGTAISDDGTVTGDELLADGDVVTTDDIASDDIATDDIGADDIATDDTVTDGDTADDTMTDGDELLPDDDAPAALTCLEIQQCWGDCADQDCKDACFESGTTEAQGEFNTLLNCVAANCAVECSSSGTQEDCLACAETDCAAEVEDCRIDENAPVYGTLTLVNTTFAYIYDGNTSIATQVQNNPAGLVNSSVFSGTYAASNKPIPPTASGSQARSLAAHYAAAGQTPAMIRILMQVTTESGALNPMVQLRLPSDNIIPGVISMDGSQAGAGSVVLVNSTGTSTSCLLAYSFGGSVTVTAATNTTAVSGGTLTLSGSGIEIYYPTETPLGDITDQLGTTTICPKE
ncbi:MAG TPA: hypothetical protein PLV42_07125 [bacterium]|nr:hypothetical protein [bacterium]